MLFLYLKSVTQGVTKKRPTEKQVDTKIQVTLKHTRAPKLFQDKMT